MKRNLTVEIELEKTTRYAPGRSNETHTWHMFPMKRKLTIEIDCGERTCYSEQGKHCQYLLKRGMHNEWLCGVFREHGEPISLRDENGSIMGWLQRCQQCVAAEGKP